MTTVSKMVAAAAGAIVVAAAGVATFKLINKNGKPAQNAGAPATQAVRTVEIPRIAKWSVLYQDAEIGAVRGTATINWDKASVRVVLVDPRDKKEYGLGTKDLEVDDTTGTLTMRLRGESPAAPPVKPPAPAGQTLAADGDQAVLVEKSNPKFNTVVKDKALAELDGVHLTLHVGPFGTLSGEWSYQADPLTKRNAKGSGRSGFFRLFEKDELGPHEGFLGEVTGPERWTPLPAVIDSTFVLEQQLEGNERTGFLFPYPFTARAADDPLNPHRRRTLLVVGRNLPFDGDQLLRDAQDGHVMAWSGQRDLDPKMQALFDAGWQRALAPFNPADREIVKQRLDAALISIELRRGDLPGPRPIVWGEAKDYWFLQFGDNTADARFIRRVTRKTAEDPNSVDQFEQTTVAFLPEEIAVEVLVKAPLPLERLAVTILAGANALSPTAEAVPGSPGLFRTKFFTISKPNEKGELKLAPGEKIRAAVKMEDMAFVAPPHAEVDAYLTPDQIRHAVTKLEIPELNVRLWKEALVMVERAQNLKEPDLSKIAGRTVGHYNGVRVTAGEQAAMLLLRSSFLKLMNDHLEVLKRISTDDQVLGFRDWVKPMLAKPAHFTAAPTPPVGWEKYPDYLKAIDNVNAFSAKVSAAMDTLVDSAVKTIKREKALTGAPPTFGRGTYFGELPVTAPKSVGGDVRFYETFGPIEEFSDIFKGDEAALREWKIKTGREVLTRYRLKVSDAIFQWIIGIQTNDLEGLVDFTAAAYPAVQSLIPTLMELDAKGRWVADFPARAEVGGLNTLVAAAHAARDYSNLKRSFSFDLAWQLLSLVNPEMILGGLALKVFTRVAPYGVLAWQAGSAIYDQALVREDIDKLFGTAGIVGTTELEAAAAQQKGYLYLLARLAIDKGISKLKGRASAELKGIGDNAIKELAPSRLTATWDRLNTAVTVQDLGPVAPLVRRMSWSEVKKWPAPVVKALLELAEEAEASFRAATLKPRPLPNIGIAEVAPRALPTIGIVARAEAKRFAEDLEKGTPDKAPPVLVGGGQPTTVIWMPAKGVSATKIEAAPGVHSPGSTPTADEPAPRIQIYQPQDVTRIEAEIATALEGVTLATQKASRPPQLPAPRTGSPARGAWVRVRLKDGREVEYLLDADKDGNALSMGQGATSDVYGIKDIKGLDAATTDKYLSGLGAVIKFAKDSKSFGTREQQVIRSREVDELLKARAPGVLVAEMLGHYPDASEPHMIQRKIPLDGVQAVQIKPSDIMAARSIYLKTHNGDATGIETAIARMFPETHQEAFLKVYADLAKAGLASPDLSLPNMFFSLKGGVRAGIIDVDHIVDLKGGPRGFDHTWRWLGNIDGSLEYNMPSATLDGRDIRQASVFMQKILEFPMGGNRLIPLISLDPRTLELKSTLINVNLIPRYFEDFRVQVEEVPKKRSAAEPARPWLKTIVHQFALWLMPQPLTPAFAR